MEYTVDADYYKRVLGSELRKARQSLGLSQHAVAATCGLGINRAAITHWENGDRQLRVEWFVILCRRLGVNPVDLLARVRERVGDRWQGFLRVDLHCAAAAPYPPLRAWAQELLKQVCRSRFAYLDPAAIDQMAELCGVTGGQLIETIRTVSSEPTIAGDATVTPDTKAAIPPARGSQSR